jgi:hypothetical protein
MAVCSIADDQRDPLVRMGRHGGAHERQRRGSNE